MPANGLTCSESLARVTDLQTGVDRVGIADRGGDQLVFLAKATTSSNCWAVGRLPAGNWGWRTRQNILRTTLYFKSRLRYFSVGIDIRVAWLRAVTKLRTDWGCSSINSC